MRVAAVLLSLLSACNVVHLRERSLRAKTVRAGLVESTVALDGDTLHLWRGGTGPPVLLLHGFGASAIWQWHDQIRDFVARHHIVMPDLLGFGGSGSPGADASLQHQTRAMIALLDRLQIEQVDVVGISYGGMLGYSLAGTHPERVRRLVLVDSPGHAWSAEQQQAMLRRFGARTTTELFVPTSADHIRTLMALASARPPRVPDWAARQAIAALYDPHRADQSALLAHLEGDIDRVASEIVRPRAPTLVVWGADDPVFPLAVGRRLAADLGAELVVLAPARHMPNADLPAQFNRAVLRFLGG